MAAVIPPVGLDSTQALVARAREGDRAASDHLAARYQAPLLRLAQGRIPRSARGLVDAADIVQVVMMRVFARLDRIDASIPGNLLAYLRSAVLNQIFDEGRRARRRPQLSELDDQLPSLGRDPLAEVISQEEMARYDLALMQLPTDQHDAFVLRIEMDCSFREIADALGRPSADAARMLVRRAILAMAEALRETPPE